MNRLRLATLCRSLSRNRLYSTATADGTALSYGGSSFPYRWLRDSCQCPNCVHPSTKQKLHRTSDIREDVKPAPDGVRVTEKGVDIAWSSGHDSHYAKEFLELYASPTKLNAFHRDEVAKQWDVSELQKAKDLFLPYESLQTPSGMLKAITQLSRYGLLFTTGVPNQKTSHEQCELTILANKFGEIRETFYGKVWDVKNIRNSRNIAYTNIDLGLHMDILYFQDPPRFQILHCLRNRVEGGMSIFVDSLHAANVLRESDPEAFDVLASTPVEFHYINDGHHLHYAHPTIELAPLSSTDPAPRPIAHLNYSPPFQAPLPLSTPKAFYPAFERFVALLEDSSSRFEYTLREGDAVLFDNRRVLHARTAFTGGEEPEQAGDQTNRWLKGCYLEADAVWDRGRVLAERLEKGE
ncbi:Clavaminate synthase-like protein [Laetiporus sulphureus 93-53]|uniref:Clavaminate synthase-like protein n=1 Tax=Laetiporus sulphureus 93-53 TaxID=1314785 RepID=A0A165F2L5_9APHY|nr:Clavaminate synthase-like protein [Laetiporus sulphureus 93-53]KZT08242.1 Clavaminate synthase-like protein [Laetiporus sulphureus 93-53]